MLNVTWYVLTNQSALFQSFDQSECIILEQSNYSTYPEIFIWDRLLLFVLLLGQYVMSAKNFFSCSSSLNEISRSRKASRLKNK